MRQRDFYNRRLDHKAAWDFVLWGILSYSIHLILISEAELCHRPLGFNCELLRWDRIEIKKQTNSNVRNRNGQLTEGAFISLIWRKIKSAAEVIRKC